ncbi:MAG: peptidylprolyl isomerase, partial [Clostridia bacterium]|nr:peptidylprolyl isomerase [Clostridia bacterium]
NYITEDVFMLLMSVDCLEDKLFSMLVSDGGKIEDNDEKLTAILMGDDFVRAKQIFIENDKGEDVENNRKIAEEALEKYLSGEDLATLIGRYSEDISMPADGYYFTHLEMIEEFETAAFALGDGEVSGVVESEDGFHIIVRLPKDEKYIQDNFSELKSQYQSSAFYKMIDARAEALRATESEFVRGLSYEEIH